MRIVVVGTIVADTIEHAAGGVTESLGGIAHTVVALSVLAGDEHTIVPLCRAGADCRDRIEAWAEPLTGVSLEAIRWCDLPLPTVHLSYAGAARPGERIERLHHAPSPLRLDDLVHAGDPDLVLVNCITGSDCTREAMVHLRARCGRIYLDVHSLALGSAADGSRFLRPRDDWPDWLVNADVVQCNRAEAATICELPVDGADEAVVADAFEDFVRSAANELAAVPRTWILTLAETGAVLFATGSSGPLRRHFAAPKITLVDPTGAGDTFGAAYASAWLNGATPEEATLGAIRAASAACTVPGAVAPSDLRKALAELR